MGCVVKSASGLSLVVGDKVYDENGKAFIVLKIDETDEPLLKLPITVYSGVDCKRYTMHSKDLFHFRPDKCADGMVLKCGQVVYPLFRDDGPFIVDGVIEGFVSCHRLADPDVVIHISPDGLTHNKTAVNARGIRIDKGDTVYSIARAREYEVLETFPSDNSLTLRDKETGEKIHADANGVTYVFPDSWERIEKDAKKNACDYFDTDGRCGKCPQLGDDCQKSMCVDLVKRCKKVVEMMPYDER